jgi:hypothetical protein
VVVNTTQPVLDFAALLAVSSVPTTPETAQRASEDEDRARSAFKAQEIASVADAACAFATLPKPARYIDTLVIEMSGPLVNPYDASLGTFVRTSAGGRPGATWLWVRLERRGTNWKVAQVIPLPVNDG